MHVYMYVCIYTYTYIYLYIYLECFIQKQQNMHSSQVHMEYFPRDCMFGHKTSQ